MKIGLFIPCYVDAFFPEVGIATLELLERLELEVEYPLDQTCCGQPMGTNGCQEDAAPAEQVFVNCFKDFEYIVSPSASCVHHIRSNLALRLRSVPTLSGAEGLDAIPQTSEVKQVRNKTYELVEFIHDILKINHFPWTEFPHRVGLHNSCSAIRKLGHTRPSELMIESFSKTENLLEKVKGLELITLDRPDECCGFGGTFCVFEEAVSAQMGYDKVQDHWRNGAEYIVSADMSCLMHQKGIIENCGLDIKVIHIAQILNGVKG